MKRLTGLIFAGLMLCGGHAFANDNCRNVHIHFQNSAGTTIKVTGFKYYDYDKNRWRSKAISSLKVNDNQRRLWRRDLAHVRDDETRFKVTYKKQVGGRQWSGPYTVQSDRFTCRRNMMKSVTLN